MDQIVDQIRAALVPGALPEARAAGATACRAILAALGASPDVAREAAIAPDTSSSAAIAPDAVKTSAPTGSAPTAPMLPSAAIALVAQLGRIPAEHRVDVALDLAIAKLGAMLLADAPPIDVRSPRFALVPLGAHIQPSAACASCGERVGHGWWCKAPSGRRA